MKPVKLGDVCEFDSGFAFSSDNFSREDGIGLIRIRDIKNGTTTEIKYVGNYDKKFLVYSGDYLIGMDGEFKCYQWSGKPSLLNQRVCRLREKKELIDSRYFFYGINRHLKEIEDHTTFTTVKHISVKQIKDISFPLPSLEEQQRVVERLDATFEKIDRAIGLTQKNIELSYSLRGETIEKSMTQHDSMNTTLGKICTFENGDRGKNYPSKSKQTSSGIPFINAGNLNRSELDFNNMAYISKSTYDALGGGKIKKNDILFCLRGSLGKYATVAELEQGAIASSLVIIRPDTDRALLDYLLYYLEGSTCKRMIRKYENGAAQPNLSAGSLKKFEINLPVIADQIKAVNYLNEAIKNIDEAIVLYKCKIDTLSTYKQSMLQQAFSKHGVQ